ncbi:MAG: hypothetical protein MK171_08015 [Pirellulales bacterium]|nr:hypothetical protein [Pirellulales bacterium]
MKKLCAVGIALLMAMFVAQDGNGFFEDFESYEPSLTNLLSERFNQDPLYGIGNSGWTDYYRQGSPSVLTEFGHIVAAEGLGCVSTPAGPCYGGITPPTPSYARPGVGGSQGLTNVEGGPQHGYARALDQAGPANSTVILSAMVNMEGRVTSGIQTFFYLGEDDMVQEAPSSFRAWLEIPSTTTASLEYGFNAVGEGPSIFPIDDANKDPVLPVDGWLQYALEVELDSSGVPIKMSARHRAPSAGSTWERNPHDANQSYEPKFITGAPAATSLTHAGILMGVNATIDNVLVTDTSSVINMPGDVNGDLVVDVIDLNLVLSNWGDSGMELTWGQGDIAPYDNGILTGDFIVDEDDYTEVLNNLGTTYLLAASSAVPEPATSTLLFLAGLTGWVCRRHRKRVVVSACLVIVVSLLSVPTALAAERAPIGKTWIQQHPFQIMGHQENLGDPTDLQDPTLFYGAGLNAGWSGNSEMDNLSIAGVPWHHVGAANLGYNDDPVSFQVGYINALNKPNSVLLGWHIADDYLAGAQASNTGAAASWLRELTNGTDATASGIGTFDLPVWGTLLPRSDSAFGSSNSGYTNYVNGFISAAQPDILNYQNYTNLSGSVASSTLTTHYNNLMLARNAAQAASYDLPYATFIPGSISRNAGPTTGSSEARMRVFSALATGHKAINYFRYDGPGNLFSGNPNMVDNTTGNVNDHYDDIASVNAEVANLGKSLKFLDSTGVRYIKKGTATAVPSEMPAYASGAVQSQMTNIQITSPAGAYTDGMIGYFDDDKGDEYFMLTNLNFDANIASTDALDYSVTFDGSVTSLQKLDRATGAVEVVNLTGNTLNVTLPGGTGELYKYNTGTVFAKEQEVTLALVPVVDPSIPEHYRTFDVMATVDSDVDSFEFIFSGDRAGSIYQHGAPANTYTEPNPADFGANPDLEFDTYVTMAPGAFSYPAPVGVVTDGASTLDPSAVLTFDNKDLNIAWSRTNDTFDSGTGTHRVARVTMQNRATATYEVRGEQSGIYANSETIEGAIATDIQPMTMTMEPLADQTGVPAGFTTYDILATVDSDLSVFEMILTTDGGPGSIFQHGSGTNTEPDPALFGANPTLPFDSYVTMGAFTHAQGATLVPGVGASTITPGSVFTFDDETLNILWTLTSGTFQSDPGTFEVGRVTLNDTVGASWTVMGWQADDASNPVTIVGNIESTNNPADFNMDGVVDSLDLGILLGNFGTTATPETGELNGTSPVDSLDLGIFLGSFGSSSLAAVSAVPEPMSIVLLAFASLSLLAVRPRK